MDRRAQRYLKWRGHIVQKSKGGYDQQQPHPAAGGSGGETTSCSMTESLDRKIRSFSIWSFLATKRLVTCTNKSSMPTTSSRQWAGVAKRRRKRTVIIFGANFGNIPFAPWGRFLGTIFVCTPSTHPTAQQPQRQFGRSIVRGRWRWGQIVFDQFGQGFRGVGSIGGRWGERVIGRDPFFDTFSSFVEIDGAGGRG